MSNQRLQDYMYRQIARGVSHDDLKKVLIEKGWKEEDINEAVKNMASLSDGSPFVEDSSQVKRKFMGRGLVFVLLLTFALIGAGIYGYFYVFLAPEKVVARSMVKMQDVKIFKYSGSADIRFPTSSTNEIGSDSDSSGHHGNLLAGDSLDRFAMVFSGGVDVSDPTNQTSFALVDLKMDGTSFTKVELKSKGDSAYVNVHSLNDLGLIDTSIFINRWVKFDLDELAKQYSQEINNVSDFSLSNEERDELGEIFSQNPPFEIVEKLASEKIGGLPAFHYKFKIDKENLGKLTVRTAELLSGGVLNDKDRDQFYKSLDNIEFSDGEIWIGKKDLYIYKLKTGMVFKNKNAASQGVTMDFDISFAEFNQPLDIEVPSDYTTFEELLTEVFGELEIPTEIEEIPIDTPELLLPSEEFNIETILGS